MRAVSTASLALLALLAACGSDKKSDDGYFASDKEDGGFTPTSDAGSDEGEMVCAVPEKSPIEVPDSSTTECFWDLRDRCGTGKYCETFQDSPPQPTARCVKGGEGPATRLLGTVFDFGAFICGGTLTPKKDVELRFVPALEAATDADAAWNKPIAMTKSGADGRFDITADLTGTTLGVIALVGGSSYYRSANGHAVTLESQPEGCTACYGKGADAHDMWVIPKSLLDGWSNELKKDEAYVSERMPLGQRGGTLGVVRLLETGEPIPGVILKSAVENGLGRVRYLNEDLKTFNSEKTTRTGAFVVVGPSLAQGYYATLEGKELNAAPNLAGSTPNSVLIMMFNVRKADLP